MNVKQSTRIALLLIIVGAALACRTADTISQIRSAPTNTRPRPAPTDTRGPTRFAHAPQTDTPTEVTVAENEAPTETAPEEQQAEPTAEPTTRPAAPPPQRPTAEPQSTEPPPPTASQYKYQISDSRCGPNVRTYIEGYVYEDGAPKNGILVRISQGPDGQPDPNPDYRTGTDPRAGYFFQNIDANAPHGGTWYLWLIDPETMQRISAIEIVKTDPTRVEDTETSSGSCQSAEVSFSNEAPIARPTVPPAANNPNATPTQDILDDSPGFNATPDPLNDSP
ncbi:MAG TPA: hypothetical protein VFD70_26120 [Anaerolineae bacterium]|nr:hypothetical protein [Anaerolineae bacterium]